MLTKASVRFAQTATRRTAVQAAGAAVNARRNFSAAAPKVAVIGAAGGIGQPLSLLLKASPLVSELNLYDVAPVTPGVAADLSHINTGAKVTGFGGGNDQMLKALEGCDVVVVPAGVPRKPGMTRDDLFNINAGIVAGIATGVSQVCPDAALCIISNPVNSTVPIAAEIMKKAGTYNKNKLFGVTSLDVVRANTFVAENQGFDVNSVNVPVVGGHAGITIIPLLSHVAGANFSEEEIEKLTHRIMFGGDEVVQAKAGGGSATLSMAWAGAYFAQQVLLAAAGKPTDGLVCSYVESDVASVPFFSSPIELGKDGMVKAHPVPAMNDFEQSLYEAALPELQSSIDKGVEFAKNWSPQ